MGKLDIALHASSFFLFLSHFFVHMCARACVRVCACVRARMCVPRVAVDSMEEQVPVAMIIITRSIWKDRGNIDRCAHTLRRPSLHIYENIFLFSVLLGVPVCLGQEMTPRRRTWRLHDQDTCVRSMTPYSQGTSGLLQMPHKSSLCPCRETSCTCRFPEQ